MSRFKIEDKTIERYLKSNEKELAYNGYKVYKGQKLREIKDLLKVKEIDFPQSLANLGVFNFRSFLDLAMLLKESDKARYIRSLILNIVIEVLNEKLGKPV